jgi:hypothetical protein
VLLEPPQALALDEQGEGLGHGLSEPLAEWVLPQPPQPQALGEQMEGLGQGLSELMVLPELVHELAAGRQGEGLEQGLSKPLGVWVLIECLQPQAGGGQQEGPG